MSDRNKLEQMLEHLVNDNREKAEELFHELVVAKSREIYENLLDDDVQVEETDEEIDEASDEEDLDEASDEEIDEASDEEDLDEASDEEVDEMFGMNELGGDPADDMMSAVEVGGDEGGMDDMDMMSDEGGDEPATKDDVLDIKDALEELKADFEAMLAGEAEEDEEEGEEEEGDEDEMDFGGDDEEEKKEDFVREYTEKKTATMGDNGANTKSIVAGKNDMGGTTANIAKSFSTEKGGTQGGLANPSPKDMNTGNVNKVGGTNAKSFYSKDSKGHGVEKKGSGDNGANTKSLIGGKK
jgi:hypothetical protein